MTSYAEMKASLDNLAETARRNSIGVSADDDMFDFAPTEGAMTMTLDPATFYVEQATLACVLKWLEAREIFHTQNRLHQVVIANENLDRLARELRSLYDAQERM